MGESKHNLQGNITDKKCPLRPKYHFLPPSNWINDPNGPIFHKGEYHLFYQYNPFGDQWGNIHWGHAKSKDLVYWEHLPIALKPSKDKGESHCFSGSCVVNDGVPTIIYTSIGPNRTPATGAEQWLATSDHNMIEWKKYEKNPVMTQFLNKGLKIHDWRDPFIWKERNEWYLILGGHINEPVQPIVLLYKSHDLYNWKYVQSLCIEDKSKGKNWECPNFFKLNKDYILIVSPHNRVIYSIGTYKDYEFKANEWRILDHGKLYYATNGIKQSNNRIILWAWIKAKGMKNWNGCLTLPRYISLGNDHKLIYQFPSELNKIRLKEYRVENTILQGQNISYPFNFEDFCFEIEAEFNQLDADIFYFKLTKNKNFSQNESIGLDFKNNVFWAGKDKICNISFTNQDSVKLHIYIDFSIIEVIVNGRECITTQMIPQSYFSKNLELRVGNGKIFINRLKIWNLKSIW